jgi:hypothetical protein
VGNTIAFNIYNKPFKPIGLPSGRVKSNKGLPEMIPTNIMQKFMLSKRVKFDNNNDSHSLAILTRYTPSSNHLRISKSTHLPKADCGITSPNLCKVN